MSHSPKLVVRYDPGYEKWGPAAWLSNMLASFSRQLGVSIYEYVGREPLSHEDLEDLRSCRTCGILYQMPKLYLEDFKATAGAITEFSNKTYLSVFAYGELLAGEYALSLNGSQVLVDNDGAHAACQAHAQNLTAYDVHIGCHLVRQCVHQGNYLRYVDSAAPRRPVIYLKAVRGEQWNTTIIDALKEEARANKYPDIETFTYGHYDRELFLRAAASAPWMIAFSPGETFGWFHIEARLFDVPLYVLRPQAVTYGFTNGTSGTVIDDRTLSIKQIRASFRDFLNDLATFSPLEDLKSHGLVLPNCASALTNLTLPCYSRR